MERAKICPSCGAPLVNGNKRCSYCGVIVRQEAVAFERMEQSARQTAVNLSGVDYIEDISCLIGALFDDRNNFQFCGISYKEDTFVQIAWAFEEYPTIHLYLDADTYEEFTVLDISSYFSCTDPVNFPYNLQSNVYLLPETAAALLTVFIREVLEADESDLVYDIEGDKVEIGKGGEIMHVTGACIHRTDVESEPEEVLTQASRATNPYMKYLFFLILIIFILVLFCTAYNGIDGLLWHIQYNWSH